MNAQSKKKKKLSLTQSQKYTYTRFSPSIAKEVKLARRKTKDLNDRERIAIKWMYKNALTTCANSLSLSISRI